MEKYDFIIIGGGCAGIGFFLQILKDFEKVLLLEQNRIGGDIWYAHRVTNFPGFCDVKGNRLCSHFEKQLEKYKRKIKFEKCIKIEVRKSFVIVKTEKNEYSTKYCIIATGRKEKVLKKFRELNLKNRFDQVKGKNICVIGGGEVALDQSLTLTKKRKKLTIISKGNFRKVNKKLLEEVKTFVKDIYPFSQILYIYKTEVDKYRVFFKSKNKHFERVFDDILLCIGSRKNLPQIVNKSKRVLLCGSVKDKNFKQGSISFADGVKLAMKLSSERRQNESFVKK
ncbi:MAG: NAD(P)/FAD-dependent oxidoreductase [candidate division WOR-3 bacterium]